MKCAYCYQYQGHTRVTRSFSQVITGILASKTAREMDIGEILISHALGSCAAHGALRWHLLATTDLVMECHLHPNACSEPSTNHVRLECNEYGFSPPV